MKSLIFTAFTLFTSLVMAASGAIDIGPLTGYGAVQAQITNAVPTAVPAASAGTGATCTLAHTSAAAGTVTIVTTATLPGTGDICDVTFNYPYTSAPICVLFPATAATSALIATAQPYVTSSLTAFSINNGVSDATGHTYTYNFSCTQTK